MSPGRTLQSPPLTIGCTTMGGCGGCQYKGMSTAVERTFVGVRFGEETNLTLCATGGAIYACGERVVVERQDGLALGKVEQSPMPVFKPCQKNSAVKVVRAAADEDVRAWERQRDNEVTGKRFCQERAKNLGLEMKVSRVDFPLFKGAGDLLLHLRRADRLPPAGARPVAALRHARADGAGRGARRGRACSAASASAAAPCAARPG